MTSAPGEAGDEGALRRRSATLEGGLFLSALALSAGALGTLRPEPFGKYPEAARLFRANGLEPSRVLDFSPLYFHLNAALAGLTARLETPLLLLQCVAFALCALLLFRISVRFFPAGVALAAAAIFCLTPGPLVFALTLEPEIWVLTFTLAGLWFLYRHLSDRRPSSVSMAGLCLGLSILTRPTGALLVPAFLVPLLVAHRRKWRVPAALFLAPPTALVLGLLARNAALAGEATLAVMDPGAVFFESNNPLSRGFAVDMRVVKDLEEQLRAGSDYAHVLWKRIPSAVLGRPVGAAEANAYWAGKAVAYLRENPGAALRLAGEKARLLFRSYEVHDVRGAHQLEERLRGAGVPLVPFSAVAALALPGLLVAARDARTFPLFAGFAGYSLFSLVYYVGARTRTPLVPFALFFLAASLDAFVRLVRGGRRRGAATLATAVAATFALLAVPDEVAEEHRHVFESLRRATDLRAEAATLRNASRRGEAASRVVGAVEAAPFFHDALVLANLPYPAPGAAATAAARLSTRPLSATSRLDLGILLLDLGRPEEARRHFEAAAAEGRTYDRWCHASGEPETYLGRIAAANGNREEALAGLQRVLERRPGEPETLAHLAVLLQAMGKPDEARAAERRLFSYLDEADASFLLGLASWRQGDAARSADRFLEVVRLLPDYRTAHIYAAAALGAAGRVAEGVAHYQRAVALRGDPAILEGPILELFARHEAQSPGRIEARSERGRVLRQYGRFEEARQVQTAVLREAPGHRVALAELDLIARALAPR